MRPTILILLAIVLSGCTGPNSEPRNPDLEGISSIEFTDCATSMTFERTVLSGEALLPKGWNSGQDLFTYYLDAMDCKKIAMGSHEFRDVGIIMELAFNGNVHDSCRNHVEPAFLVRFLQNMWTGNQTLSDSLTDAMGISVGVLSSFSMSDEMKSGDITRATWATESGLQGSTEVLQAVDFDETANMQNMLIWSSDNKLAFALIQSEATQSDINQGPSRMSSSHPLAPSHMEIIGRGNLGISTESWTIEFMEGLECD